MRVPVRVPWAVALVVHGRRSRATVVRHLGPRHDTGRAGVEPLLRRPRRVINYSFILIHNIFRDALLYLNALLYLLIYINIRPLSFIP